MIGFTGSRHLRPVHRALVGRLVQAAAGHDICVGCASGLDALVRDAAPGAQVFSVASGAWGDGRGAYAARSRAMVQAIAQTRDPHLVGVVSSPCVPGIVPDTRWRSGTPASGTWSTIALAIGLQIKTILFVVDDGQLPQWQGGTWAMPDTGIWAGVQADGWQWTPKEQPQQLSLF